MFVILVYDTLAERNPQVLKTCRHYLHWTQRSVFQGELSTAQHRSLTEALKRHIDPSYDSVIIFRSQSPHLVQTETLGQEHATNNTVL